MRLLLFIALMVTSLSFVWANQHSSAYFDESIWLKSSFSSDTFNSLPINAKVSDCVNPLGCDKLLFGLLSADELTAYSSLGLVFVTVLLVIVGAYTACVLLKQTKEFKNSVDESTRQFVAINRAWISFEVSFPDIQSLSYPSPILFENSGMYLTLKFTLRNVGKQPAFNVRPYFKIILNPVYLKKQQQIFCESIKNDVLPTQGITIFPGDSGRIFTLTCNLAQSEIDSDLNHKLDISGGNVDYVTPHLINVAVIGCIDYRSTLYPAQHYQTRFAYRVSATQAKGGMMTIAGDLLPVQKDPISLEHLILSPDSFDDCFSAD